MANCVTAGVYSFGVLLLEIVSGTRNKDPTQPDDEVYLPHRVGLLIASLVKYTVRDS